MNRRQYAREFEQALDAIEKRFVVRVARVLRLQFSSLADALRSGGVAGLRGQLSVQVFNAPMLDVISSMQKVAGVLMAKRTLAQLQTIRQKRTMGFNQEWTDEIIRYFRNHNLDLVTKIDATSRAYILEILERGVTEGLSVDQMAKEINDRLYLAHRAARIIRTETTRAANHGVQLGAGKYEYEVVKEWNAVSDNRTRDTHRAIDAQQREGNEPFSNGLMFPGDPQGPAKETVNCRCSMAMVPKRDANGRLIPKRGISLIMPSDFVRNRQLITI